MRRDRDEAISRAIPFGGPGGGVTVADATTPGAGGNSRGERFSAVAQTRGWPVDSHKPRCAAVACADRSAVAHEHRTFSSGAHGAGGHGDGHSRSEGAAADIERL